MPLRLVVAADDLDDVVNEVAGDGRSEGLDRVDQQVGVEGGLVVDLQQVVDGYPEDPRELHHLVEREAAVASLKASILPDIDAETLRQGLLDQSLLLAQEADDVR